MVSNFIPSGSYLLPYFKNKNNNKKGKIKIRYQEMFVKT